jgi:hypothetical protein
LCTEKTSTIREQTSQNSVQLFGDGGHAMYNTFSSLSFALQVLEVEGIDVRSLAFDGDTQYLGFLMAFEALVDQIQKINLEGGLKGIVADQGLGIVEDGLHLLKTIRYRFVKAVNYFILPFEAKSTINRESWRSLGISDKLLSDSQAHKQEDELAMKLLEENSLSGLLRQGDCIFSFAYYPGFS